MSSSTSSQRGASRRTASGSGGGQRRASTSSRSGGTRAAAPRTAGAKGARKAPQRTTSKARAPRRPAGPWVPAGVLLALVLLGWALYPALRLQYQTSRRVAGLERQYQALQQRNRSLKAEVAELKTPEGVAKAAREGLGFTKAGEHVYVVMPAKAATPTAQASAVANDARTPAQVVLDALFGVTQPDTADSEP